MTARHKLILGYILIVCAAMLFGLLFRGDLPDWQGILVIIGSLCTLSKGWGYLVEGHGLDKTPPVNYDKRGPPL